MKYLIFTIVALTLFVTPEVQAKGKKKKGNSKSTRSSNLDVYRKRLIIAQEKLVKYEEELASAKFDIEKEQIESYIKTVKSAIRRYELLLKGGGNKKNKKK